MPGTAEDFLSTPEASQQVTHSSTRWEETTARAFHSQGFEENEAKVAEAAICLHVEEDQEILQRFDQGYCWSRFNRGGFTAKNVYGVHFRYSGYGCFLRHRPFRYCLRSSSTLVLLNILVFNFLIYYFPPPFWGLFYSLFFPTFFLIFRSLISCYQTL